MPFATSETANGQPSRIVSNVYGYYNKVLIVIEKYVDLWSRHDNAWIELNNLPNHVLIIFNASVL